MSSAELNKLHDRACKHPACEDGVPQRKYQRSNVMQMQNIKARKCLRTQWSDHNIISYIKTKKVHTTHPKHGFPQQ